MKAHASSESHIRHFEAELTAKGGSIAHQLRVGEQERTKNQVLSSMYSFPQHIPHTTNFDKLINLVACGRKDLDEFVERRMHPALHQMLSLIF